MSNQEKKSIWRFESYWPSIDRKYQLTLGEGNTPLKRIEKILFKCEFLNPSGSVKDRGIAYQIAKLLEKGVKSAVISSSGNAAISAAQYCQISKIVLHTFVSPKINKNKLARLIKLKCQIHQTNKPVSAAFQFAKKYNLHNLRQSTDPNATFGFETIAYELEEQEPRIDAIFLPVSSGTTLVGIADGYLKMRKIPALHLVQTEAVNPLASQFDQDFSRKKKCLSDAIVARFSWREKSVINLIKKSYGFGWVISDEEMQKANSWLLAHHLVCSYEGAAALASLWKAQKAGYNYMSPVCLLTGKYYTN